MALTKQNLFDAFLLLLESDEWDTFSDEQIDQDLEGLAKAALPWFKFPRCNMEWDQNGNFDEELGNTEIQIWVAFMKVVWYGRVIDSWENLRPMYTERDFSPAKMLSEYRQRLEKQEKHAANLEKVYYRSIKGKPFDYRKLAGN